MNDLQLLSRQRSTERKSNAMEKIPELDEFLIKRDYSGAMSLLQASSFFFCCL